MECAWRKEANIMNEISLFDENENKKSQSTLLIEIGQQGQLFHDQQGDAYAEVEINDDIRGTFKVRSKDYKNYLSHQLFLITGKGANSNAITDALSTLEAIGKFEGDTRKVSIRVYNAGDAAYIDTGDKNRRIIKIDSSGYRYTKDCPVHFVRKNSITALPVPAQSNLSLLRKYINCTDKDYPLVYGWMLCALAGVKPYPILIVEGEQGSGKSTACRVIRELVDPSSVSLRSPPKQPRDLLVSAMNTHTVNLDNLSGISPDIADTLCRLSTGGGHDQRALYTDDEQCLVDVQKPVMVNGIDDIATRPDLAERSLIVTLQPISCNSRKEESEFWSEFKNDKPAIFAGLLNAIVDGFKYQDGIELANKPRMADAAKWITACEQSMGNKGAFIDSHADNQLNLSRNSIESSPVGNAIFTLMQTRDEWHGTPTELFNNVADIAGDRQSRSRSFPQSHKGLFNVIKRLKKPFRDIGILIERVDKRLARKYIIKRDSNKFYLSQVSQNHPRATDTTDATDRNLPCLIDHLPDSEPDDYLDSGELF